MSILLALFFLFTTAFAGEQERGTVSISGCPPCSIIPAPSVARPYRCAPAGKLLALQHHFGPGQPLAVITRTRNAPNHLVAGFLCKRFAGPPLRMWA